MFTELVGDVMDIDAFAEIDVEAKLKLNSRSSFAPLMTTAAVVPLTLVRRQWMCRYYATISVPMIATEIIVPIVGIYSNHNIKRTTDILIQIARQLRNKCARGIGSLPAHQSRSHDARQTLACS